MSYETVSESRAKKLEGILTDTSDIIESDSEKFNIQIDLGNQEKYELFIYG